MPSATITIPACRLYPIPTPPPWWKLTQVAPGRRVQQRVEDRPVGDRVRPVAHALCLPERRGHRARVQVVAPDDDRGSQLTRRHHLVDAQPCLRALAVAEPADPGRQALERHLLLGQAQPSGQAGIFGEELHQGGIGLQDVIRIARQGGPAEGALALAEEGADEGRHEAGEVEGIGHPGFMRLLADVVAVVEDDRSRLLEGEHGSHVIGHRRHGAADVLVRVALAERVGFCQADASRHVPAQRIVGGGLVGDEIGVPAAADELRLDVGRVADQRHAARLAGCPPCVHATDRLVEVDGQFIHEAGGMSPLGACGVDLDRQACALVHGDRQRLGPAHAAQPCGERGRAPEGSPMVLARGLGERLIGALDDSLGGDVDPRAGGHLAVHRQAGALELAELLPRRPVGDEVRVGDEDPRRVAGGAEDADGLAALHEQRLVVAQLAQLGHDGVERLPAARRPPGAAVDDEVVGVLGHVGVEVVHEHPQGCFLLPAAAGELCPARRPHRARAGLRNGAGHAPMIRPAARAPRARRWPFRSARQPGSGCR